MAANKPQQLISRSPDLKRYRTELPNLYDDMGLSPYEYRLLGHYCRVGTCWESVRTTSEKCKMSIGMIVKTRNSLVQKGLINIQDSDYRTVTITVVDVWERNFSEYTRSPGEHSNAHRSPGEHDVHQVNDDVHHMNNDVHGVNQRINHIKNEPFKKEPTTTTHNPARQNRQEPVPVVVVVDDEPGDVVLDVEKPEWEPEESLSYDTEPESEPDPLDVWTGKIGKIAQMESIPLRSIKNKINFLSIWLYAITQESIKSPGAFALSKQGEPNELFLSLMEQYYPTQIRYEIYTARGETARTMEKFNSKHFDLLEEIYND
jgi:hypothetical protein